MELYRKNNISVVTLEEEHKNKILDLYNHESFNCDFETGSLRPSNSELNDLMDKIIDGYNLESILVLLKNKDVIGYLSMFIEYDRLHLGHIAVDKNERNKGYGKLLTCVAILLAENDDRDVTMYCNYPNRYLKELGFKTPDGVHYLYKHMGVKTPELPKIFASIDEYKVIKSRESEESINKFSNFLKNNKDLLKRLD